jgi:hypothetical protein
MSSKNTLWYIVGGAVIAAIAGATYVFLTSSSEEN